MTIIQEEFRLDIKLVMITQNKQSRRVKRPGTPLSYSIFLSGKVCFHSHLFLCIVSSKKKKKDLAKRKMTKYNKGIIK